MISLKLTDIPGKNIIYLLKKEQVASIDQLSESEKGRVVELIDKKVKKFQFSKEDKLIFLSVIDDSEASPSNLEKTRKTANKIFQEIIEWKIEEASVVNLTGMPKIALSFAEGLMLSGYQFLNYYSDKDEKVHSLIDVSIVDSNIKGDEIKELNHLVSSVFVTRDLVNEPVSTLNAVELSEWAVKIGEESGFSVQVMNKQEIIEKKMGGLLAVNKGSIDPPTFSILEWKPENQTNTKPIVLVGKGVVYDTGGLSLKPTSNSMDYMKSDMAGAAAVIGTMAAVAKAQLPMHVIGLIPATDNRPDGNAYAPGDVVLMHNQMTVEVMNTDAEGRMILADALSYAKMYEPELVVNVATLTGSAAIAIGSEGIVAMGNASDEIFSKLSHAGFETHERIARFPFWDEYAEKLKSDIADTKNLGGREAGAITAGKFLEKFTDYPFVHLDIAGTAYSKSAQDYKGKGASGTGVRLLYHFLKNY
jgi:leucyl aminopeptidase